MQQIGTNKSLIYGAIIMLIFAISSCEFSIGSSNAAEEQSEPRSHTTSAG